MTAETKPIQLFTEYQVKMLLKEQREECRRHLTKLGFPRKLKDSTEPELPKGVTLPASKNTTFPHTGYSADLGYNNCLKKITDQITAIDKTEGK